MSRIPDDVRRAAEQVAQGLLAIYAQSREAIEAERSPAGGDGADELLAGLAAQTKVVNLCRAGLVYDNSLAVSILKTLASPVRDRLHKLSGADQ